MSQTDTSVSIFPETVTAIIILVVTLLINTKACIQEISKEIVQAVMNMTKTISHNKFFKRASEKYRKALQAVTDMTRMTICNSCSKLYRKIHSNTQNRTGKQKLHDQYDRSYTPYNANTLSDNQSQHCFHNFTQRPNETQKHQTFKP